MNLKVIVWCGVVLCGVVWCHVILLHTHSLLIVLLICLYSKSLLFTVRYLPYCTEHSSDWQPFLKELTNTQMFSLFVDERALQSVGGDKLQGMM